MLAIKAKTATEAFDVLYMELLKNAHDPKDTRGGRIVSELLNVFVEIEDPTRGFITSPERSLSVRYAVGELLWYLSGSNKTADISQYSSFWDKISDDGIHANSAYGYRIFDKFDFNQWEFVKEKLTENPSDRQAVIHIKEPNNTPSKDVPCTIALQFQINDGKLYLTTFMRSNDIWRGFPYDVFAFTALQVKMAMELGISLGSYTHCASNMHLYEENRK